MPEGIEHPLARQDVIGSDEFLDELVKRSHANVSCRGHTSMITFPSRTDAR